MPLSEFQEDIEKKIDPELAQTFAQQLSQKLGIETAREFLYYPAQTIMETLNIDVATLEELRELIQKELEDSTQK